MYPHFISWPSSGLTCHSLAVHLHTRIFNWMNSMSNALHSIPAPPPGKSGWPWTVESDTNIYKAYQVFPRISIVTPSFNQERYLEETIRSILLQNYPNLELIIIDGGSTDSSVEIIKKYEPWISYWVSEKDNGQSHALNKGFDRATGEWVGWQNSDDVYLKDSFGHLLQACKRRPADVYFGHSLTIDADSQVLHTLYYAPFSFFELKYNGWNITNQSTFFSQSIVKKFKINETYRYAMDGDFYFRLADSGCTFALINQVLGAFRLHGEAKTGHQDSTHGLQEWKEIRKRYGITQTNQPWREQFRYRKIWCRIRKTFFLAVQGNLLHALNQKVANS
jgi:glycosyltransferase involved in cell wall biosynthesis